MTATAYSPALDRSAIAPRKQRTWHSFFAAVFSGAECRVEDEIAQYLQDYRHDLPPAVGIELERRMGA